MDWLLSVYIGTTIFGVGVTIVDLMGLLGHEEGDGDGHDHDDGVDHDGDHDYDAEDAGGEHESVVGHEEYGRHRGRPVLMLLTLARSLVYFCLGFGPVGWFALARKLPALVSLFWSVPVGIAAMVATRGVKRLMRKNLDSQVNESSLLMEKAVVLVSIARGQMGKVRVILDDTFVERYAMARNPEKSFPEGSEVFVVDLREEYLLVEDEKK